MKLRFGNNAASFCKPNQRRKRREKPNRTYLGNGKVVWNNGTIVNAEKEVKQEVAAATAESDFPF
jgi:hypothetical protein